jgi:hypothetical protein
MFKLPNFLIIGAAKSGTTALYSYLKQHPQVFMCPMKEPKFFAHENKGPEWCGPGDEAYRATTVTGIAKYMSLFHFASDAVAVGEASTQYLYMPGVRERIKRYIPDTRLIAILRNPVEVAFSAYLHKRRDGHEPLPDFEAALADEERRIRENWSPIWHYKRRGIYYPHLSAYYEAFDPAQLRVYLYEDLCADPRGLLTNIFSFLGVQEAFSPDILIHPNRSGLPRSRALHSFLTGDGKAKRLLKRNLNERAYARAHETLVRWNLVKPELPPRVRRQLIEYYRDDVSKLQTLLRRDLSSWLRT